MNSPCLHQGAMIKRWLELSSDLAGEQLRLYFDSDFTRATNLKKALEILFEVKSLVRWGLTFRHAATLYSSYLYKDRSSENIHYLNKKVKHLQKDNPSATLLLSCLCPSEGFILWVFTEWLLCYYRVKTGIMPPAVSLKTWVWAQFIYSSLYMIYKMNTGFMCYRIRCVTGKYFHTAYKVKYKLSLKTNHVPLPTFTEETDFSGVKYFLKRFVLTWVTVFVSLFYDIMKYCLFCLVQQERWGFKLCFCLQYLTLAVN